MYRKLLIFVILVFALTHLGINILSAKVITSQKTIDAYAEPHTPKEFNKVGLVIKKKDGTLSKTLVICISGWRVGTAWFKYLADYLAEHGIDVCLLNRRQTLLENRPLFFHDVRILMRSTEKSFPAGKKIAQYSYSHDLSFIKYWGMDTQVRDIKTVVDEFSVQYSNIYLCGWSAGVSYIIRFVLKYYYPKIKGLIFLDGCGHWHGYSIEKIKEFYAKRKKEIEQGNLFVKTEPDLFYLQYLFWAAKHFPTKGASCLSSIFHGNREITYFDLLNQIFSPNSDKGEWFYKFMFNKDKYFKVKLQRLVDADHDSCHLWEWFYPQAVSLDYWDFGLKLKKGKVKIHPGYAQIPILNIKCSGTSKYGKDSIREMMIYFQKIGFNKDQIQNVYLEPFYHADIFIPEIARSVVFDPIIKFIKKNR